MFGVLSNFYHRHHRRGGLLDIWSWRLPSDVHSLSINIIFICFTLDVQEWNVSFSLLLTLVQFQVYFIELHEIKTLFKDSYIFASFTQVTILFKFKTIYSVPVLFIAILMLPTHVFLANIKCHQKVIKKSIFVIRSLHKKNSKRQIGVCWDKQVSENKLNLESLKKFRLRFVIYIVKYLDVFQMILFINSDTPKFSFAYFST